jgi:uncharacterized membrane protein YphA (DoxX/SURF4 family)
MTPWIRRGRLLAAWLLGLYLARMYARMGWVKFDPHGFWTPAFERWGFPVWFRILIGVLEVGGAILLVVPWTASYGGIILSVVMSGAWVRRVRDGYWVDVAWISAYFVALIWIAFEWWPYRLDRRIARRVD